MPTKLSKYKQSLLDIANENFGTLDNLVTLSNDNGISLSDNLQTGTNLVIANSELGEADIKQEIFDEGYIFNNDYEAQIFLTVDTTLITADSTLITADTK